MSKLQPGRGTVGDGQVIAELVMKALMLLANTDLSVEERELLEHLDAVQNDDGTATVYEV